MTPKARTLLYLLVATASGMCLWFMTAAILPEITAEAGLTKARQSLLSSVVQAGFVVGALSIAFSGLADRLDPRKVLATCAIATAGANALLLVIPIDGFGAVLLRFATGALMAGVYPVGMKITVGWGLRDRGLLVGILVGTLTLGKSVPYGLAFLGGADWRMALGAGSLLAAAGGCLVLISELGPYHRRAPAFRPEAIRLAWTDPRVRSAYLGYFGHMWELYVLWAWGAAAATASYALTLDPDAARSLGKLTAFVSIAAGAPFCVIAGLYADRIGKARVAIIAMIASGSLAILTAFSFGGPPALTFALFVLWGIAVIPDSAQFSALVADFVPPEWAGSLLTLQTALGFLLTVATVQITPLFAAAFGWPTLMACLAIGPFLGVLAMRPLVRLFNAEKEIGD
ncbi:MFS transporter [Hoeflea sp. WL0058]|uniref:MFS transporter n=1 Tax=Flavimaribacter sediminis TaxID=2865987 RepID=A0AAE2ZR39_9HYPH|nr:MFS transporter [Flavimaribacter sediminis]MBW8639267.1 MFS transporter [Flavimaribacter sediminis]